MACLSGDFELDAGVGIFEILNRMMQNSEENPYQAPILETQVMPDVAEIAVTPEIATSNLRLANFILDRIFVVIIFTVYGFVYGFVSAMVYPDFVPKESASDFTANMVIGLFGTLLYYLISEAVFGRTLGKLITGTKVIDSNGNKPSFQKILIRTFARLIPFEQFSFLANDARGWHDSLSGTWVVKAR